ncbi:hypothetical protein CHH28_10965 [Bacterioplanes sanyensis]|uniref:C-type lectin domain-containing protein n=1 Tax=Bacterioplanes sanyensis TaxID=1249553 RepID=A0A222FKQ1_9GAMM|nr:lectin-like protein [Bacterioplanes sanyensis]ASP39166.1 hypothetical protein CHH28_10965 [Bacterioplanes sanyensis]
MMRQTLFTFSLILWAANSVADWQGSGPIPWAPGQPDVAVGQCAVARSADGLWQSADCDSRARSLCTDGNNWQLSNSTHQFSNTAIPACVRQFGESYRIAAPETDAELALVNTLVTAQAEPIWLNLKYQQDTGLWQWNIDYSKPGSAGGDLNFSVWYDVIYDNNGEAKFKDGPWKSYPNGSPSLSQAQAQTSNNSVNTYFAEAEPNGYEDPDSIFIGRRDDADCVQMYTSGVSSGLWDDTQCNQSKRVACYNGSDWKVSTSATSLGSDSTNEGQESFNVQAGHAACAQIANSNGIAGDYLFAAPVSFDQSQALAAIAQGISGNIWINGNDTKFESTFVFNVGMDVLAPFWNSNEPNGSGNENCAVQTQSGGWQDVSCNTAQPIACFDAFDGVNGRWQIGNAVAFSSARNLSDACEAQFGGRFQFFAPVTLSQQADLKGQMTSGQVFINASDSTTEGVWKLNQQINIWDVNQPGSQACVAVSANSGRWTTANCSDSKPVACSSGSQWYFTTAATSLSDFAAGQALCDSEFGQGYLFKASRTLEDAQKLRYDARIAGVGGDYWINGNRLSGSWVWNNSAVQVPIWSGGEPDGGELENCATLASNGDWSDEVCGAVARAYLCRNGNSWQITGSGQLDDFRDGTQACELLGNGWRFAAPATLNDNTAAADVIAAAGGSAVWINASDKQDEDNWVINAAPVTGFPVWAANQPDNGGVSVGNDSDATPGDDCVYQDADGQWSDSSCTGNVTYPFACTDGSDWKVTTSENIIRRFAEGHHACFVEFGGDFVFASPQSTDEVIKLDFARLTAAQKRGSAIDRVWLNLTDGGSEGEFRANSPFSNWLVPDYPGQEPAQSCAYKSSVASGNNPWRLASCSQDAAHYACFNGSRWRIAISQGELVNGQLQIVPQVGEDYWSYERGERLCKQQFGSEYYFAAPVTAVEEAALDAAIRSTNAQVKNTWLNMRYLAQVNSSNNRWFNNRIDTTGWAKPAFGNFNNSDCSVLHTDASITDADCSSAQLAAQNLGFACFDGSWQVLTNNGNDDWRQGFRRCDEELGALFAVPRSPDELAQLQAQMSGPVWVNMTDTALESQWITNRERYTWWASDEPRNDGNRDCALLQRNAGEWQAQKCDIQQHAFACRTLDNGAISWQVTQTADIWSRGFAACQREFPGSEFYLPTGFGSVSASQSQLALQAVAAGRDVWINFSDQEAEGNWRSYQVYSDWSVDSLFDDNLDCGYFDRLASNGGTWQMDVCQYTPVSASDRGYACTDGYEWRLAPATGAPQLSWTAGFSACQALGNEWRFATPTNAVENAKLKLAMEIADLSQVWINAQDRVVEGNWWLNGDEVNFPPLIDSNQTNLVVSEQSAQTLHAALTDEEGEGIASADWELVSDSRFTNVADSDVVISTQNLAQNGASATLTASYTAPTLLQQDAILVFRITATDIPAGTAKAATAVKNIRVQVKAPAIARYTFDDSADPGRDVTGNGHDALNTQANPLPAVENQSLVLNSNDVMVVPGIATDNAAGLVIPSDEYTVAFRLSIEQDVSGNWRGILQKGDDGSQQRQPGIFLYPNNHTLHTNSSRDTSGNGGFDSNLVVDTPQPLLDRQWVNVIYQKTQTGVRLFIDGVEAVQAAYSGAALSNDGNLYIGNVPGASESFVGWIDDIQIFRRALSAAERDAVLPPPPAGEVLFTVAQQQANEDGGSVTLNVERRRGSVAPLQATISFVAAEGTATLGSSSDVSNNNADVAFDAAGSGDATVNWAAGERGTKSVTLTLATADDAIREGTETAVFRLPVNATVADVAEPSTHRLRLADVTPNPFGNFSAETTRITPVYENDQSTQQLCIWRRSGSDGNVTVNFNLIGNAVAGVDYQVLGSGLSINAGSGSASFTTGGSVPESQCVDIQILNRTSNDSDRTLTLELANLTAESGKEPLLTDQDSASLTIRDWAPGEFNFVAGSYSCKEPNTDSTVPSELRPTSAELTCEVEVERSNTGVYAPAASVNIELDNSGSADGSDAQFATTLSWPEITSSSPVVAANEIKTLTINVANDNVQENDESLQLNLQPATVEVIGAQAAAAVTLIDVTSPALLELDPSESDLASVPEGRATTVRIVRSENTYTDFDVNYQLLMEDIPANRSIQDYIDFAATGISSSGVLQFAPGVDNEKLLQIRTKPTINNSGQPKIVVELSGPNPARVVGLGALSQANKGTPILTKIMVVEPKLEDYVSVTLSEGGQDTVFGPGATPALPSYLVTNKDHSPARRQFSWSVTVPSGTGVEPGTLSYQWQLRRKGSADGSWFDGVATQTDNAAMWSNQSGSVAYNNAADATVSGTLMVPFVLDTTEFELVLQITGNQTPAFEPMTKIVGFNAVPLWRKLRQDNDNACLRNGSDTIDCSRSDTQWTWNPDNRRLIHRDSYLAGASNYCFELIEDSRDSNDPRLSACSGGSNNLNVTFPRDGNYNEFNVAGEAVCSIIFSNKFQKYGGGGGCTAGDRRWAWQD